MGAPSALEHRLPCLCMHTSMQWQNGSSDVDLTYCGSCVGCPHEKHSVGAVLPMLMLVALLVVGRGTKAAGFFDVHMDHCIQTV